MGNIHIGYLCIYDPHPPYRVVLLTSIQGVVTYHASREKGVLTFKVPIGKNFYIKFHNSSQIMIIGVCQKR